MFAALRTFLDELAHPAASPRLPVPSVRLAAGVLLVEVMRAADGIGPREREAAAEALRAQFGVTDADLQPLLADAQRESAAAYDYFRFTEVLDHALAPAQKVALVEALWRVAYADLQLDVQENAVIAKVADLLHVAHETSMAAKMRAQGQARDAGPP